jgi:hypothetical protein
MMTKTLESPGIGSIVMIGAGLCAALLFTVGQQGTFQAVVLAGATPLPIMISTLGFGPAIGLGSAAIAALTVAFLATIHIGAISAETALAGIISGARFALIQALPAWWLGFLSCLARPEDTGRWRVQPADKKPAQLLTFYPVGHILLHAAVIAICLVGLGTGVVALGFHGFDAEIEKVSKDVADWAQKLLETYPDLPANLGITDLAAFILKIMPMTVAACGISIFVGNLWLAGRIVQTSNKLPRPWPDIAHELRLPRLLVLALGGGLVLCQLKGWPSTFGLVVMAALGLTYALQGLAVVHDLSRRWRWRGLMLTVIYATLFAFIPWPLVLFAPIGLADTALNFRDRKAALLSSKT